MDNRRRKNRRFFCWSIFHLMSMLSSNKRKTEIVRRSAVQSYSPEGRGKNIYKRIKYWRVKVNQTLFSFSYPFKSVIIYRDLKSEKERTAKTECALFECKLSFVHWMGKAATTSTATMTPTWRTNCWTNAILIIASNTHLFMYDVENSWQAVTITGTQRAVHYYLMNRRLNRFCCLPNRETPTNREIYSRIDIEFLRSPAFCVYRLVFRKKNVLAQ